MPKTLTAENGAKAALNGEFKVSKTLTCPVCFDDFDDDDKSICDYCEGAGDFEVDIIIDWSTIKEIYKKSVEACQVTPNAIKEIIEIDFLKSCSLEDINRFFNVLNSRISELEPNTKDAT